LQIWSVEFFMVIIGLTGSIGTGKSTTGKMFASFGFPVYDADVAVHELYQGGPAIDAVEARFPGVVVDGNIDREKLSAAVLGDPQDLRDLEAIVHPLVHLAELEFLKNSFFVGNRFVVLEIPLLFETGGEKRCDLVVTTIVADDIQRQRVMARDGMTLDKFEKIIAKQMPMSDKKKRSHFCVDTGPGMDAAKKQVKDIVRAIRPITGHAYKKRLWAKMKPQGVQDA
jgi:dephospho-CoA kinase